MTTATEEAQGPRAFKRCTSCGHVWADRGAFLADPSLEVVGYQAFFEDLVLGLFLINHQTCGTTLAIKAQEFHDLYDGPIYSNRLTETDRCSNHCFNSRSLEPCPRECECAYVREILQLIKSWPKQDNDQPGPAGG